MFKVALFPAVKRWKLPMAINGWMDKQNVVCAFNEYYLTVKMEWRSTNTTTWMDLENIMGSKRSQTHKATVCRIPFKGSAWTANPERQKSSLVFARHWRDRTNDRDRFTGPHFSNFYFEVILGLQKSCKNSIMIFFLLSLIQHPLMLSSFPATIQLIIKSRKLTMKQVINWTTELFKFHQFSHW